MKKKTKASYAIACLSGQSRGFDPADVFFVTINTTDEAEATRIASCVCGKRGALLSLIIINEHGQVFPCN